MGDTGTFVLGEDNTYPIGEHAITYKTRTAEGETVTWDYTIQVVDGKTVDYYVFGKNSATFTNANWQGGTGIRVAAKDTFIIPEGATEMPAEYLNSSNGKLLDLDDAMLVINRSESDIAFTVNDTTGVHVLMDRAGFVKMVYEGIQNDYWDENGMSKKTPSVFGSDEKTVEPGDIYFVVGSTESGNYYCQFDSTTPEKHWKDGRFIAKNTVAGPRYGNMAQIKLGENLVTDPYTNQMPYLSAGDTKLTFLRGQSITEEMLLADVVVYDDVIVDGAALYQPDVKVTAGISITGNDIQSNVVGNYTVTYTVQDNNGGEALVFNRPVEVINAPDSYVSFTNNGVTKIFEPKYIAYNATNDNIAFTYNTNDIKDATMFVYDSNFTGQKPSNTIAANKRPFQYTSFVVYGSDGKVKAYINAVNAKLVTEATLSTGGITAQVDQMKYFKLNATDEDVLPGAYELQPGDKLYSAMHTGANNNMRDFLGNLTLTIYKDTSATLAEKTVELNIVGLDAYAISFTAPAASYDLSVETGLTTAEEVLAKYLADNAAIAVTVKAVSGQLEKTLNATDFIINVKTDGTSGLTASGDIVYEVSLPGVLKSVTLR